MWIGPTGIGNPALSAEQIRVEAPAPPRVGSGSAGKPMAIMCIAGDLRAMTSPGAWKVVSACDSRFSTGYATDGYGSSFGSFIAR